VLKAFFDIMNEKVTDKENIICYPLQCNYICNNFIDVPCVQKVAVHLGYGTVHRFGCQYSNTFYNCTATFWMHRIKWTLGSTKYLWVLHNLQEDTKPESKYVFISLGEGVTAEIYQN